MNKQISYKETIHLLILLLKNSFNLNNKPFFDFYNRLDYKNVSSILIKKYDLNPGLNKFSISQLALFIKCFIVSILRNNIKLTPLIFFLKLIQSTDPIEFHSLAFNKFSSLLIASRFSTKFVQTFEYQHGLSNRFSYEYILSKKVLPNVRRVPMKSDVHFLSNLFKKYKRNCTLSIEPIFTNFIYKNCYFKPQFKIDKTIVYVHSPIGVYFIDNYIDNVILKSPKIKKIKPHHNSNIKELKYKFVDDEWLDQNKGRITIISFFSSFLLKANFMGYDCLQLTIDLFPNQKIDFLNQINFNRL